MAELTSFSTTFLYFNFEKARVQALPYEQRQGWLATALTIYREGIYMICVAVADFDSGVGDLMASMYCRSGSNTDSLVNRYVAVNMTFK